MWHKVFYRENAVKTLKPSVKNNTYKPSYNALKDCILTNTQYKGWRPEKYSLGDQKAELYSHQSCI